MCNVRDIDPGDRIAIEHLVGRSLSDDQQLIIQIVGSATAQANVADWANLADELPEWCNVYQSLSDDEIADLEKSIVRCTESRSFG